MVCTAWFVRTAVTLAPLRCAAVRAPGLVQFHLLHLHTPHTPLHTFTTACSHYPACWIPARCRIHRTHAALHTFSFCTTRALHRLRHAHRCPARCAATTVSRVTPTCAHMWHCCAGAPTIVTLCAPIVYASSCRVFSAYDNPQRRRNAASFDSTKHYARVGKTWLSSARGDDTCKYLGISRRPFALGNVYRALRYRA